MFDILHALFRRELLVRPRRRWFYGLRLLFVGAVLVVLALTLFSITQMSQGQLSGRGLFFTLSWCLFIGNLLIGPLAGGEALMRERQERTLGLLTLCGIGPGQLLFGKVLLALASGATYLLSALPLLLWTVSLGGLATGQILWTLALQGMILLAGVALGLLVASLARDEGRMLAAIALLLLGANLGPYILALAANARDLDGLCDFLMTYALPSLHHNFLEGNLPPLSMGLALLALAGVSMAATLLAGRCLQRLGLEEGLGRGGGAAGKRRPWWHFRLWRAKTRPTLHFADARPMLTIEFARFRRLAAPRLYLGMPLTLVLFLGGTILLVSRDTFVRDFWDWFFWGNLWLIGTVTLTLVVFLWVALHGLAYTRDKRGAVLELLLLTDLSDRELCWHKTLAYLKLLIPLTVVGIACFITMGLRVLPEFATGLWHEIRTAKWSDFVEVTYVIMASASVVGAYLWGLGILAHYGSLRLRKLAVLVPYALGFGMMIFSGIATAVVFLVIAGLETLNRRSQGGDISEYLVAVVVHAIWLVPPTLLGSLALRRLRHDFRRLAMSSVGGH